MAKKILVVDDDRNIGQILYVAFKSKGYDTLVAKNGEEALRMFEESTPDLVLLDVLLPRMNGWEVCQRIKETEAGARTPIVLMSAIYKSYKLQADARKKYGADDFVEKPFQLGKLIEKIYSFIGEAASPGSQAAADGSGFQTTAPATIEPPPEPEPEAMLEGTLGDFPFPALLHKIHVLGRSGVLSLAYEEKSKEVAFKEGYPVSVKTNIEGEFLGRYLVGVRKITPEQCEESLKRMERTGRLQGTVLIEMGALTPHELVRYLKLQMREKIFEVFAWADGTYRFVADDTVVGDISNIDMSPANLILRGVAGRFGLRRLIEHVDAASDRYPVRSSNMFYRFQDLDLTPSEFKLLALLDGRRRVRDVLAESDLDLDKSYQILYTLLITEMYDALPSPAAQAEEIAAEDLAPTAAAPEIPDFADLLREADEGEADANGADGPSSVVESDDAEAPAIEDEEAAFVDEEMGDEGPAIEPTEDAETRRKILEKYEAVLGKNHFQVLGVGEDPTDHEIRVAYHRLAKEFHPDRFFGRTSSATKAKAEEVFQRITEAYQALDSREKLENYKKEIEGTTEKKSTAKMDGIKAILRAERSYQMGIQAVKDRQWEQASVLLRKAMDDAPSEPEYQAYYGWAIFNLGRQIEQNTAVRSEAAKGGDLQFQAREYLNRAIAANPRLERGHVFLGYVYKAQGLKEFAEREFERALLTNPNCVEALRELRLMRLAAQRARTKKKTFLDKVKEKTQGLLKR
jgi:CheY-like chemotaxis protein